MFNLQMKATKKKETNLIEIYIDHNTSRGGKIEK